MIAGPDEIVYRRSAQTIRDYGIVRGSRLLAERFLAEPNSAAFPSPIRWLWTLACAVVGTKRLALASLALVPLAASWALWRVNPSWQILALAASSPLLWIVARRELQDGPVAALTLVALGFALRGDPVALGLTLAALLAVKEVSPLAWPALCVGWFLQGHHWWPLALALAGASALWALLTLAVFRRDAIPVIRRALGGHGTQYTRDHQRGGIHRLFVDVALLSPLVLIAALGEPPGIVGRALVWILFAHALVKVQNARTVLAADILLRALAAATAPLWILGILIACDAWIIWRTRRVYDPVTAELTSALGMSPQR